MTGTYTKGPWTFDMGSDGYHFSIHTADGPLLESCFCCGSPWFNKDAQANAHLITAAPELFEAAQQALRIAEEWIEIEVERPDALESHLRELDSVRAAIAKARGEA